MRKLYIALLGVGITLNAQTITALKTKEDLSKINSESKIWQNAKFEEVIVYPQTTISFNDKNSVEANKENGAKKVMVASLHNDKHIALNIKWKDQNANSQNCKDTDSFGDGFAIQIPTNIKNPLPYIGMGSEGREVLVYIQKSINKLHEPTGRVDLQINKSNTLNFEEDVKKFEKDVNSLATEEYKRAFISQGFRSMTEAKDAKFTSSLLFNNGQWSGTFARSFKDDYLDIKVGVLPVAIAIWEGEQNNRDGLKKLSSWIGIKLEGKKGGEDVISALEEKLEGDIEAGKKIAMENCAACHQFQGADMAPPFMAPNLSNIGGYSNTGYLRESILNPNGVIVPGYNRNAHPNFAWYQLDNGKRVSTMPDYNSLDKKSQNDLLVFLKTLKSEIKE